MWLLLTFITFVNSQCYWNNKHPYRYFGTKTPYDVVRGDFRDVADVKGCKPISVWFMTRHGVRHPNADDAALMKEVFGLRDDILKSYVDGRGEMCAQDITDLRDFIWDDELDNTTSKLTTEGFQELLGYGKRFGEKFASFLENLDESLVRSTSEIRTRKSCRAFMEGLEGINQTIFVAEPVIKDKFARPYRYCKRRGDEVIFSSHTATEISRYQETPEFRQLVKNVQQRSGITSSMTPRAIMGLYDLCRFYRSYTIEKRSPWCALFSDDELRILEYVEDIKHYIRNGYGHPMNLQLGAAGLKDLYEKFVKASRTGHKILTGYFTHDTMIDMIYTAMGLFHDYPEITSFERNVDRKWRTSFLTPFVANFVAVLYRCPKGDKHSDRIQFFINEKEVHLCGARLCTWNDFKNKFEQFADANLYFCDEKMIEYNVFNI